MVSAPYRPLGGVRRQSHSGLDSFLLLSHFTHLMGSSQTHCLVLSNQVTLQSKRPPFLMVVSIRLSNFSTLPVTLLDSSFTKNMVLF